MTRIPFILALLVTVAGDSIVRGSQKPTSSPDFLLQSGAIPTYPRSPWTARFTGIVDIAVTVEQGEVVKANAKSSADQTLVNAAVANVKTWKFSNDTSGTFATQFVYELEAETTELQNPRVEMRLPQFVRITARPVVVCHDCNATPGTQPVR